MSKKFLLSFFTFFISISFFVVVQKATAAAPTSGLVGLWNFDEGSATSAGDLSGINMLKL